MKIKKILVLLGLLLLTGCDIEYNLTINDNKYNDIILIKEPSMITNDEISFEFDNNYNYFKEKYPNIYTSSRYNENGIYQVLIEREEKNIFNIKKDLLTYSEIIESVDYNGIGTKSLIIKIKDSFFNEYKIDSFTANIKIPYNVVKSNSVENKNNIYKFILNSTNRTIDISYNTDKNKKEFILDTNEVLINKITMGIIITILVLAIAIPLYLLVKKGK